MHAAPLGSAQRHLQERRLVSIYQRDPASRDEVVAAFATFVTSLAQRYFRGGEPLEDLEQVAFSGLVKALQRYDLGRSAPFAAFAVPTITGELRRHYRDHGWSVHVTRKSQEAAQRVTAAERAADCPLTAKDLAERLGMTEEDVVDARLAAQSMFADSLDAPVGGEANDERLVDRLGGSTDPGYADAESRLMVDALLDGLAERDRLIVRLRFEQELTQREIGQRIGLSQMQVSRLLQRIVGDLQQV